MINALSAALIIAEANQQPAPAEFNDAQAIVDQVLRGYREHPAGDGVFDCAACYHFDHKYRGLLYPEEARVVRLAPHQIWAVSVINLSELRTNPTGEFRSIYDALITAAYLKRFGEVGYERCAGMLSAFTMPFDEYLIWSDDNTTLDVADTPNWRVE